MLKIKLIVCGLLWGVPLLGYADDNIWRVDNIAPLAQKGAGLENGLIPLAEFTVLSPSNKAAWFANVPVVAMKSKASSMPIETTPPKIVRTQISDATVPKVLGSEAVSRAPSFGVRQNTQPSKPRFYPFKR